jgi:hypothetical protein
MVKEMIKADTYLPFLQDQYGNYVVQKTLAVAEKDDLEILITKMKPEMEALRKGSSFGQRIYNKLVVNYPGLQDKTLKSTRNKKKKNNQKQNKVLAVAKCKSKKNEDMLQPGPIYQSYNNANNFFPPQPPVGYYGYPDTSGQAYPPSTDSSGNHQYY